MAYKPAVISGYSDDLVEVEGSDFEDEYSGWDKPVRRPSLKEMEEEGRGPTVTTPSTVERYEGPGNLLG